jgi:serine phosphatase RsbU (regulator of sigma subunit)/anti-sigma regulatory factor (Ser/Thr protein kinase)
MVARLRIPRWIGWRRERLPAIDRSLVTEAAECSPAPSAPEIDIAPNDPLLAYFQSAVGAVDVNSLELHSPALDSLRSAGVRLVVPLVSQGELIGLLNLGPRLSEQEYSSDDQRLLNNLAAQAAPAVRVAQLVKEQEAEARERERIQQELRVAQLIQQQFLPKELPTLPGWQLAAHYQPARAVGGDFYDVFELPEGQIGLVAGDVTDKGVPAALVMASTRSLLRADAPRLVSPSKVLARVNDLLLPSIPARMFVTCIYAVLDPITGSMRFANAGHNLPYLRTSHGVEELRATGMPLGLMPGMTYDEQEATLLPGQSLLLYSDGLVEAHNGEGEMFGFPRLKELMQQPLSSHDLIDFLMTDLGHFTGPTVEQEDDITLVALHWSAQQPITLNQPMGEPVTELDEMTEPRILADFTIRSEPGNERIVMDKVAEVTRSLNLAQEVVDRLKTAVSEATMNAIEHGNKNQPELPVEVRVVIREATLSVEITDQGRDDEIHFTEAPDLDLKLAGLQSPRGWGLFLIKNMVDEMHQSRDASGHTLELIVYLKGLSDANPAV